MASHLSILASAPMGLRLSKAFDLHCAQKIAACSFFADFITSLNLTLYSSHRLSLSRFSCLGTLDLSSSIARA